MPSNNAAGLVDQDGIGKAEFFDAGGDLSHLGIRVSSAVPSIRNQRIEFYLFDFHLLFRFEIAAAFDLASALLLAPHAFRDNANRVGSPLGFAIGPGMLPILARKLALRGLSPDLTGAFNVPPVSAL